MTNQELIEAFTHPLGIEQGYQSRQIAIENTFYQLYEAAGLQYPRVFGFRSPYALQQAINYLHEPTNRLFGNTGFYSNYPSFGREVELLKVKPEKEKCFFWNHVQKNILNQIPKELKLTSSTLQHFNKYTFLFDKLDAHLSNDMKRVLKTQNLSLFPFAHHPTFRDIAWVDYFLQNLTHLNVKTQSHLMLYANLVKNGLMYAYQLSGIVLWCPLPKLLELNELKQIHAENGPAVQWDDNYGLHIWKDVKVRKRLVEFPESISRLDLVSEESFEVRRCIREKLGAQRFASLFELIEVDSDMDYHGRRQYLYRTEYKDDFTGKPYYFANLSGSGEKEEFFVEVPADTNNVWEAMALVFGDNKSGTSRTVVKI